jgi:hypothetical protein
MVKVIQLIKAIAIAVFVVGWITGLWTELLHMSYIYTL